MAANERAIELKVGVLVVICLGLLIAMVIVLGDFSFGEKATVVVDFDTASALKAGSPVHVSGLKAGHVQSVEFHGGTVDPEVGRPVYVRVTLDLDPAMAEVLRDDAIFYIAPHGLLGEKYVEIDPGKSDEPLGDQIKTGLTPMRIEVMAQNLNVFLEHSAKLVGESEPKISAALTDLRQAAKSGRELAEEGKALVVDTRKTVSQLSEKSGKLLDTAQGTLEEYTPGKGKTGDAIHETMTHSAHIAKTVDDSIGDGAALKSIMADLVLVARTIRTFVTQFSGRAAVLVGKVESVVGETEGLVKESRIEVKQVSAQVRKVLEGLTVLMDAAQNGEGTIGALLQDREMYDDIREMMKDLKRHPWKFLWKE